MENSEKDRIDLEGEDPEVAALTWRDSSSEEFDQDVSLDVKTNANDNESDDGCESVDDNVMEVEETETDYVWKTEWDDISLPSKLKDALFALKEDL